MPSSALTNAVANSFDPADFFPADASLIGGIALRDIVNDVVAALDAPSSPQMLTRNFPDRVEASFIWNTDVTRSDPAGLLVPEADDK